MTSTSTAQTTAAVLWAAFGAYFFLASGVYLLFEGLAKGLREIGPRVAVVGKTLEAATKISSGMWFAFWAWSWLNDPTSHGSGGPGTFVLTQVICIVLASALIGLALVASWAIFGSPEAEQEPRRTVRPTSWIVWAERGDQRNFGAHTTPHQW